MARPSYERGKVIWLDPKRDHSVEIGSIAGGLAGFLAIIISICFAAELLAQAVVAWMGHDRSLAMSVISASGFL
ncbi:hypothetical protein ACNHKD_05880 [Methylocystis sp. JAN1]|uniref:hypothetical protein n=1 Tax=Methylocystis sp. JAN1 TaxID=3397211 RepID=UPI003FA1B4C4